MTSAEGPRPSRPPPSYPDETSAIQTTTGAGSNLRLAGNIAAGGIIALNSAGTIAQTGGIIDPGSLLINAVGSVSLPGANTVDTLAAGSPARTRRSFSTTRRTT
ncbi:MAG TPA: hypothetical protein VG308_19870 [Stellaceae bacterium]|nr:hypothetical protein [Stellaceae bacterium]